MTMSMGYGAGYADTISKKRIKRTCPLELAAFLQAIKDAGVSLEDVAQYLAMDSDLDLSHIEGDKKAVKAQEAIHKTWRKLQRVFKRVSEGLVLCIGYHNSEDEGSQYDEVKGAFFCVGGVYRLTPAGKRFKRSIRRRFYVTFG